MVKQNTSKCWHLKNMLLFLNTIIWLEIGPLNPQTGHIVKACEAIDVTCFKGSTYQQLTVFLLNINFINYMTKHGTPSERKGGLSYADSFILTLHTMPIFNHWLSDDPNGVIMEKTRHSQSQCDTTEEGQSIIIYGTSSTTKAFWECKTDNKEVGKNVSM